MSNDIFSTNGLHVPSDVFGENDFSTPESIEFNADMALTRGEPQKIMNVAMEYGTGRGKLLPENTAALLLNPPDESEEIESRFNRKRKGKRPDKLKRRK